MPRKLAATEALRLPSDYARLCFGNTHRYGNLAARMPRNQPSLPTMTAIESDLLGDFQVESNEHLDEVERNLLILEDGQQAQLSHLHEIFRYVHSIKGVSAFLDLGPVTRLAHDLETVLNLLRERDSLPPAEIVARLLPAVDVLRQMINHLDQLDAWDPLPHQNNLRLLADQLQSSNSPLPPEFSTGDGSPAHVAVAHLPSSEPRASTSATPPGKHGNNESTIRVPVTILDRLVNLAGELVLARNQLTQALAGKSFADLPQVSSKLDQVTNDLQEAVMHSRMQPVGNVLSRLPRMVRDLSDRLGKVCRLEVEGAEVELDKTILEKLCDPLTHLVRNSIDHGLELPAQRLAAGKPASGTLTLRAFHQAGRVHLTIIDDGHGIDPQKIRAKAIAKGLISEQQAHALGDAESLKLIFLPGFSTAEAVTDVSGRGVGMDVVRTNIESLGGTVEIDSQLGRGTTILLTLPLTLAIIPSLIVAAQGERYAITESAVTELVRLTPLEVTQQIETFQGHEALRWRGSLLPIVRLNTVLDCATDATTATPSASGQRGRSSLLRRDSLMIIVLEVGHLRYGLVVDAVLGPEQIVVKPLGEHLRELPCLAGATVLGDGDVAFILDVCGLAEKSNLRSSVERSTSDDQALPASDELQTILLLADNRQQVFAVSMSMVTRIERIDTARIERLGKELLLQYRGVPLPLIELDSCPISVADPSAYVLVFVADGTEVGLLAHRLLDICDVAAEITLSHSPEPGCSGTFVLDGKLVRMLDLYDIVAAKRRPESVGASALSIGTKGKILVAEDSPFFRMQVVKFLESKGHQVFTCQDGEEAWQFLSRKVQVVDLVLTDIEMPRLNGFDLCRRIKADPQLRSLPVVALTSLGDPRALMRGKDAGIDDYQVKMDRNRLLASVERLLNQHSLANQSRVPLPC